MLEGYKTYILVAIGLAVAILDGSGIIHVNEALFNTVLLSLGLGTVRNGITTEIKKRLGE